MSISITLNGDPFALDAGTTITGLLEHLQIDPRRVAVERNFVVVKRDLYGTTVIEAGDQVEVVNFVGGGSASGNRELGNWELGIGTWDLEFGESAKSRRV